MRESEEIIRPDLSTADIDRRIQGDFGATAALGTLHVNRRGGPFRDAPSTHHGAQVADTVVEKIEQLIVDGVLKTGQSLPSERRLVEKLGVSRSALREGLKLLRARGIIRTTHGKGSYVENLSGSVNASPLMHLLGSQPRTLYDLFEVRLLLETEASRLAAIRGTPADHVRITRSFRELDNARGHTRSKVRQRTNGVRDIATNAQHDHAFHLAICEASHNPVLVHTLSAVTDLMMCSVMACVSNLYHRQPYKHAIDNQHARLYQAVVTGQADDAAHIAAEHISSVCEGLKEIELGEQQLVRTTLRLEGWQ